MTDTCPYTDNGNHRYFMQPKTYTEFIPLLKVKNEPLLFIRNEWALLSCNCGSVKRVLVEE